MQTEIFFQRWLVRGGNSMNLKQQIPQENPPKRNIPLKERERVEYTKRKGRWEGKVKLR